MQKLMHSLIDTYNFDEVSALQFFDNLLLLLKVIYDYEKKINIFFYNIFINLEKVYKI